MSVPLVLATKLSTGVTGQFRVGFNMHNWNWAGFVGPYFVSSGAKSVRNNGLYNGSTTDWSKCYIGGTTTPVQTMIDQALADGMHITLCMLPHGDVVSAYNTGQNAGWAIFCANVARANLSNVDKIVFECGNEPNCNLVTPQKYFAVLKAMSDAMQAVSPNVRISGPAINASYNTPAINWINTLMAIPGAINCMTHGSFHPYYGTPEWSYINDLKAFTQRMDAPVVAAGKSYEYIASEVGWSNAIGLLANPTIENRGSLGETHLQNTEVIADYYSRYIPLCRGTAKLRKVDFYALKDENPGDPNFTNNGAHFGCIGTEDMSPKPSTPVAKDLIAHVHSAAGGVLFTRGSTDLVNTADWFLKLILPTNRRLIAWNPSAAKVSRIVVHAAQAGNLSWNVAGSTTKANISLVSGDNEVSIPIGKRSVVITANVNVDFPEFVE